MSGIIIRGSWDLETILIAFTNALGRSSEPQNPNCYPGLFCLHRYLQTSNFFVVLDIFRASNGARSLNSIYTSLIEFRRVYAEVVLLRAS